MEETMMSKKNIVVLLLAIVLGTNAAVAQESSQEGKYNQMKFTGGSK
jgi:hypothetical protein